MAALNAPSYLRGALLGYTEKVLAKAAAYKRQTAVLRERGLLPEGDGG